MSEEINNNEMELDLEKMEQVSGGVSIQDVVTAIRRSGKARYYRELLRTKGKAAAAAECCADNPPEMCGLCAAAVTMV